MIEPDSSRLVIIKRGHVPRDSIAVCQLVFPVAQRKGVYQALQFLIPDARPACDVRGRLCHKLELSGWLNALAVSGSFDAEVLRLEEKVCKRVAIKCLTERNQCFSKRHSQPTVRRNQAIILGSKALDQRKIQLRHPQHVTKLDAIWPLR